MSRKWAEELATRQGLRRPGRKAKKLERGRAAKKLPCRKARYTGMAVVELGARNPERLSWSTNRPVA